MSNDKTTRPYVKLIRSTETQELMKYPPAFMLLCQIALRAKRTDDYNLHGLSVGQALIGDYKSLGLTHRQYRTAIDKLKTGQFIATQTTSKGTIATLISTVVLDINEEVKGQAKRQSKDKQTTTIKNERNKEINIMFDQFWSNYPKRVSKDAAEKKFFSLSSDIQLKCIEGARVYADQCKALNPEKRFIKHPTTWLNQGCWDDELLTPLLSDCPYTTDEIRRFKALHASGAGLPSDFDQEYKHLITG